MPYFFFGIEVSNEVAYSLLGSYCKDMGENYRYQVDLLDNGMTCAMPGLEYASRKGPEQWEPDIGAYQNGIANYLGGE